MELERASRARESADILLNGGSLPARVESLRSDSPQTPSSPKIGPLKSMTSAPQPGESLEDASQKEASLMAEEVKRLRSQLQSATEKWARDKQMFAEVQFCHALITKRPSTAFQLCSLLQFAAILKANHLFGYILHAIVVYLYKGPLLVYKADCHQSGQEPKCADLPASESFA